MPQSEKTTARRLAELRAARARLAELEREQRRYRATFEHAPVGIVESTLDGRFVRVNKRFCDIFGYSRKELLARDFRSITHPDDLAISIEVTRQVAAGNRATQSLEKRYIRKDGTLVWGRVTLSLLRDDAGRPDAIVAIVEDISQRKQAEDALRASEERYRNVYDTAPLAFVVWDLEHRVTGWNNRAEEIFGWSRDEILGRNFFEFLIPEQARARVESVVSAIRRGEVERNVVNDNLTKSGEILTCQWNNSILYDSAGQPAGVMSLALDITAHKRAEEERQRLEAQLRRAQKMEAVGQFAGGVAHDFNNILTTILGHAELLRAELARLQGAGSPVPDSLQDIERSAQRAATLTRQLLVFSRRQVTQPEVLDLNDILRRMERLFQRVLSEDIRLTTMVASDLHRVVADSGQIEQVITNLVVNARDAMPRGGQLTLETRNVTLDDAYVATHGDARPGPHVVLAVSDTGEGMDAKTLEHMFEPFFTTKPVGEGTGLGLATAYGIVKQAGGHITVYSEPGRGSTFRVYLPAVDLPLSAPRPPPRDEEVSGGSETILVCEDDPAVRGLTTKLLQSAGYDVLAAESGEQALCLAAAHPRQVHLLVTDVIMPDMNGRKLAEALRERTPRLETLYVSGYTSNIIAHHGVLNGGVNLLEKPFRRATLLRRVRDLLDRRGREQSSLV
ncbi:MAG: PAS domain S-box protein [Planctomycetota bacterium]